MLVTRHSTAASANDQLREVLEPGESNRQWLRRLSATEGLLLLGGSSLAHFRVRVAQSHLRHDLTPSYWSLAGILEGPDAFLSVPLELRGEASDVPRTNGVQVCQVTDYDDPVAFPNVAVVRFARQSGPIREIAERVREQRSVIDIPSLMLAWLGFVWGVGPVDNPLLQGHGLPSAAFVETVYAIAGLELTPGLASAASCPEAIWQAAKWWHPYYEESTGAGGGAHGLVTVPSGFFAVRQPAAAIVEPGRRAASGAGGQPVHQEARRA
jgi:hypothetical protein